MGSVLMENAFRKEVSGVNLRVQPKCLIFAKRRDCYYLFKHYKFPSDPLGRLPYSLAAYPLKGVAMVSNMGLGKIWA